MKYFLLSLLVVKMICCGHHGRGHHHHPPPHDQNIQLLQNKINLLEQDAIQMRESYKDQLAQLQQQINSLQLQNNKLKGLLDQKKEYNHNQQVFVQLSVKPVYQIELWSQQLSEYDSSYFILIYLENEIVVKITCKINKCEQEKKHLHNAIQDGVSAEKLEIGQLSNQISLQRSLDLLYSNQTSNMSYQELVKQLFRSFKERNVDL